MTWLEQQEKAYLEQYRLNEEKFWLDTSPIKINSMIIPAPIHKSWHSHLQPLFDDKKMQMLKDEVIPKSRFFPEPHNIFRVFSMPLEDIKVVVLGQDPYPNGEAVGLAFAVNLHCNMPTSLKHIQREVKVDYPEKNFAANWRTLQHWHEQGVFLLNTALTVEAKNAGSHLGQWQWFTREVIKIISTNNPCMWLLWGAKAKAFKDYIHSNRIIKEGTIVPENMIKYTTSDTNFILEADHPAAESYNGGKSSFQNCHHFKFCNEILQIKGTKSINW